eukprot:Hpha_TRINITY_DN10892_c0_g1::TRINITY_DN10892_c0_g1_i1::g.23118::m.23118/K06047/TTL; tubulin---tyrosine ligase
MGGMAAEPGEDSSPGSGRCDADASVSSAASWQRRGKGVALTFGDEGKTKKAVLRRPPSLSGSGGTKPYRFYCNPKAGSVFCKVRELLRKSPFWEDVSHRPSAREAVSKAQKRGGVLPDIDLILEDRYVADRIVDQFHSGGVGAPPVGDKDVVKRRLINSFSGTKCLTLKATMVKTLRSQCRNPWSLTPQTFILNARHLGGDDREDFCRACRRLPRGSVWILKPSHRNKGIGIEIFDNPAEALDFVDGAGVDDVTGRATQYAAQRYIERPFLIRNRKFDMRVWVLLTPGFEIYVNKEGVLRTASEPFNMSDLGDTLSHLTNHCIQETGPNFGRFEEGNEMWYRDFQRYLDTTRTGWSLERDILPQVNQIVVECLLAAKRSLTPSGTERDGAAVDCFQLFGFDFMMDDSGKVWLIEVNGSPASAEALLQRMMEDLLSVVIAPLFPPPKGRSYRRPAGPPNNFVKVYPTEGARHADPSVVSRIDAVLSGASVPPTKGMPRGASSDTVEKERQSSAAREAVEIGASPTWRHHSRDRVDGIIGRINQLLDKIKETQSRAEEQLSPPRNP